MILVQDWAGVAGTCCGGSGVGKSDMAEGSVSVVVPYLEPGEVTALVWSH